jgi:hypothetical protein
MTDDPINVRGASYTPEPKAAEHALAREALALRPGSTGAFVFTINDDARGWRVEIGAAGAPVMSRECEQLRAVMHAAVDAIFDNAEPLMRSTRQ